MSAEGAIRLYTCLKINLIRTADGQVSMMSCQVRLSIYQMLMEAEQKSFVPIVVDTSGMCLKANDSQKRTPGIA